MEKIASLFFMLVITPTWAKMISDDNAIGEAPDIISDLPSSVSAEIEGEG